MDSPLEFGGEEVFAATPQRVAEVVEEALADVGGAAVTRAELLEELAVLAGEVRRDHHPDNAELVAAAAAADVGHAHPVQLEHPPVLGSDPTDELAQLDCRVGLAPDHAAVPCLV